MIKLVIGVLFFAALIVLSSLALASARSATMRAKAYEETAARAVDSMNLAVEAQKGLIDALNRQIKSQDELHGTLNEQVKLLKERCQLYEKRMLLNEQMSRHLPATR